MSEEKEPEIDFKLLESGQRPLEPGKVFRKAQAKALYLAGYDSKKIAEELDLERGIINGWARTEGWNQERDVVLKKATSDRLQELLTQQEKTLSELKEIREKAISSIKKEEVVPAKFSEATNAYVLSLDMERKIKNEALQISFISDVAQILREEITDRDVLFKIATKLRNLFERYQSKTITSSGEENVPEK